MIDVPGARFSTHSCGSSAGGRGSVPEAEAADLGALRGRRRKSRANSCRALFPPPLAATHASCSVESGRAGGCLRRGWALATKFPGVWVCDPWRGRGGRGAVGGRLAWTRGFGVPAPREGRAGESLACVPARVACVWGLSVAGTCEFPIGLFKCRAGQRDWNGFPRDAPAPRSRRNRLFFFFFPEGTWS